ncbi:MAG: cell division protein ZapA [Taibaiella sp.]|nr:cell division protein ZapA [Taibaiella sp.]
MADELMSITLWLAGRSYRIRIKPHEEETVRRAVKLADDKMRELRQHYAGKDDQDFLAMCLLMYAADGAVDNTHNPVTESLVNEMVARIEKVMG